MRSGPRHEVSAVRSGRRREALAALARKGGTRLLILPRAAPITAESRPNGRGASSAIWMIPDLRVLPRDAGGLLYRGFLLYRQDIQRV